MTVNLTYRESDSAPIADTTTVKGAELTFADMDGNLRSIKTAVDSALSTLTFDASGTGAIPGKTFDGNTTLVSYNTIGAPSNTGNNATGDWNINILGVAGSVDWSNVLNKPVNLGAYIDPISGKLIASGDIVAFGNINGYVIGSQISDSAIGISKFANGIEPISTFSYIPTVKSTSTIFNTSDGKLYRWNSTIGQYIASVAAIDITGQLSGSQIAPGSISVTSLAPGLTLIPVVSVLPTTYDGDIVYNNTDHLLYKWDGTKYVKLVNTTDIDGIIKAAQIESLTASQITGSLRDDQISAISASKISGQIVNSQISDASINFAKFASGLEPITVVSTIPTVKSTNTIYNTTDKKMYRWNGTSYITSIASTDISGTLSAAQIASLAASQITGQLSDSQLAAISASKISGQLVNSQIADAALTTSKFASSIEPVTVVSSIPTVKSTNTIYNTVDGKLYRWNGSSYITSVASIDISGTLAATQIASLTAGQITGQLSDSQLAAISASKISGQLVNSQIADAAVTTSKFASTIQPVTIVSSLPSVQSTSTIYNTTDSKLYRWNGSAYIASIASTDISGTLAAAQIASLAASQITGQLSDSQLSAIGAAKITGQLVNSQIADAALTTSKFASTIQPVTIVSTVPSVQSTATIYNTTDGKLYRWNGTSYIASIASTDISGTLAAAQIASLTAGQITGQLTSTQIASITAAQLTGTIIGTQITDGAISTAKIAANAVTANQIAANTITASQIAANTITAGQITSGTITSAQIAAGTIVASNIASATITGGLIAANTITGSNIVADTITAGQIAAGAITASELAANAVVAGKIAAGVITASEIAANTITGSNIAAITITANNLAANTITAAQIAAGTITATQIAAGTITSANIAAGTITASNILANTITSSQIAAGTITATQIATDTITAGQIAAGAITSSELASNSVIAGKISAGVITASEIAANTITGANIAATTITGNKLVANTITASQIAAGTITSTQIAAGTITADNILANTITSSQIAANTITAAQIAADTITAGQIAAGAITASELAAGAVTAAAIYAGSITSTQIAASTITGYNISAATISGNNLIANTITSSQIAANTITASQIAAGTITSANIAAGTIQASNIASATITGGLIAANTITAGNIAADTITAGQIAAGAITSSEVAAGAIVTSKLFVSGRGPAINDDQFFTDSTAWSTSADVTFVTNGSLSILSGAQGSSYVTTSIGASNGYAGSMKYGVNPNQTYRLTANLYAAATNDRNMYIYVRFWKADGVTELTNADTGWGGTYGGYVFAGQPTTGIWSLQGGLFGAGTTRLIPSTAAYMMIGVWFQSSSSGSTSVRQACQNLYVTTAVDNSLIVDGTINAGKLVANSITASQIAANAITAAQIAASTITATQIASGTITTSQIAAGTIVASNIASAAITGDRIAANTIAATSLVSNSITAGQIKAGTITSTEIAAQTITAGNIVAGTITATQIASATITGNLIAANTIAANSLVANSITAGQIAAGSITADRIDSRGLTIRAADNSIILNASSSLATSTLTFPANISNVPASISNSNISIDANGTIQGIASGSVGTAIANSLLVPSISAAATTANWNSIVNQPSDISNLVKKGLFEDSVAGSWGFAGIELVVNPGLPYTKNAYSGSRDCLESANPIPVTPGELIYCSAWLETTLSAYTCTFGAAIYDKTGNIVSWLGATPIAPGQPWTYVTGSITIPSNGVSIVPWIQQEGFDFTIVNKWLRVAGLWMGRHALGATVGAPSGTYVGGTLAQTVAANAANGSTAYTAITDASTGLSTKLANNAANALAGAGAIKAGSLQINTSGAWVSGSGVAITANGIASYDSTGHANFAINASNGSATLKGIDILAYDGTPILSAGSSLAAQVVGKANLVRGIDAWTYSGGYYRWTDCYLAVDKQAIILLANIASTVVSPYMALSTNTSYTISFMAFSNGGSRTIQYDLYPDTLPQSSALVTSTPTLYSYTFASASTDMANCQLRFFPENTNAGQVYIYNVKLEINDKPTTWCPNILDNVSTRNPINSGNVSTYIADAAINTAQIGNAQITSAKIGSLEVKTLNIGTDAVSVPTGIFTAGAITTSSDTYTTIQQLTITSTGYPVLIITSCSYNTNYGRFVLYRDTTLLSTDPSARPNFVIKETPGIGTFTYYLKSKTMYDGGYSGVTCSDRGMIIMEVKR